MEAEHRGKDGSHSGGKGKNPPRDGARGQRLRSLGHRVHIHAPAGGCCYTRAPATEACSTGDGLGDAGDPCGAYWMDADSGGRSECRAKGGKCKACCVLLFATKAGGGEDVAVDGEGGTRPTAGKAELHSQTAPWPGGARQEAMGGC